MSIYEGLRRKGSAEQVVAIALMVVLATFLIATGANAATFVVNDVSDAPDALPGDGVAETGSGNGITTLRAAIEEANALSGLDTITFSVTEPCVLDTPLPAMTDLAGGTTIDGGGTVIVQPNAETEVDTGFTMEGADNVITGLTVTGFGVGIRMAGASNTVENVTVDGATGDGIEIQGEDGVIKGCTITNSVENGVVISGGALRNTVGGGEVNMRNYISANGLYGIRITGATTQNNVVSGNYIGLNNIGVADPNGGDGVILIDGPKNNIIGPSDDDIAQGLADAAANVISGNTFNGVALHAEGTDGNIIRGNLIGVNPEGRDAMPNGEDGIRVWNGPSSNVFGHATAANIIAGNTLYGIDFMGVGTEENVVIGNLIGLLPNGRTPMGNAYGGVLIIDGASSNQIGSANPGEGNVISGNTTVGVDIEGEGSDFNILLGNLIGTNADGTEAVPNRGGVRIWKGASFNSIGAEPYGSRNIISGNIQNGIQITGAGSDENKIENNIIGLDVTGTFPIPNGSAGISITAGSKENVIGGVLRRQRNFISANAAGGIIISGAGTTLNRVVNNYIGTSLDSLVAQPNGNAGVLISGGAAQNTVGGTASGSRNIISSHTTAGVHISGAGTDNNAVLGNYIGVNNLGELVPAVIDQVVYTNSLANGVGVRIDADATNATIGGTAEGAANLIRGNTGAGVSVDGALVTGVKIQQNSIYENGDAGIDLLNGANNDIASPTITSLIPLGGNATAGAQVEIFVDADNEGRMFLERVTADESGAFTGTVDVLGYTGMNVTATQTTSETSRFSSPIGLTPAYIMQDPQDMKALEGDVVELTVVPGGSNPFSYQWQYWDEVANPDTPTYTDLENIAHISGVNSATLILDSVTEADEGRYRCIVRNLLAEVVSVGAYLGIYPNYADTAEITTLSDVLDGNTESLARLLIVPGADGMYSLRELIEAANNTPNAVTLNVAQTLLDGASGVATIEVGAQLPAINGLGLTLNAQGLAIAGSGGHGLRILSANNSIYGLGIMDCMRSGIRIYGASATNNLISGVWVFECGENGILIEDASGNIIGANNITSNTTVQNMFAGNGGSGVKLVNSSNNVVRGNLLGGLVITDTYLQEITDNDGNVVGEEVVEVESLEVDGNSGSGIVITGSSTNNVIGGPTLGDGNYIIANNGAGVWLSGMGVTSNRVRGNWIGLTPEGLELANSSAQLGNGLGVYVDEGAWSNSIGGLGENAGNIITGSIASGIRIEDTATERIQIRRNSIYANGGDGISIRNLANEGILPPVVTGFGSVFGTATPGSTIEIFIDSENEGKTYVDTVVTDENGDFFSDIDVSEYVDLWVTATATDTAGNTSEFSQPLALDEIPPVITLNGAAEMTLECSVGVYQELGATALDNVDGDLTLDIEVTYFLDGNEVMALDSSNAGVTYTVAYNVSDAAGNAAVTVIRTVTVVDTTGPQLTLVGPSPYTILIGATFNDPGATALDACEGNLTDAIVTTGSVNTAAEGDYTIRYNVADSLGNTAHIERIVQVRESFGVTLTLNGSAEDTAECGMPYIDPGATAVDAAGNDISGRVVVTGEVNTSSVGLVSTLYYNATDLNGNSAPTVMRTVTVVDEAGPAITLIGGPLVEVECYTFYLDQGAVAIDSCEGDVSQTLTMTSTVDTRVPGVYEVTYSAVDGRGNVGTAVREVVVLECNTECRLACQNEENPVDNDGDGLTKCEEELCLGTSDDNPDSDGDGMPDGFEVDNGLDPLNPDGDGDLDLDGSTNLDEFLDGTLPGDQDSPKHVIYVDAELGHDVPNAGSFQQPYASIVYAQAEIFNPHMNPTRIVVRGGTYINDIVLRANVDIIGAIGEFPVIEGAITGADNTSLQNLAIAGDDMDAALLYMNDVSMHVRGVLFEGTDARASVGILVEGDAPGSNIIEGCAFDNLNAGIEVRGAVPLFRDSAFTNMALGGVIYREGVDVGAKQNGRFKNAETGWNFFDLSTFDGQAILNLSGATSVMEMNDWGTNDEDAIAARMEGSVDFVPFLGMGSNGSASTVYVVLWDAESQERITDATVKLVGQNLNPAKHRGNGVYVFSLVSGGDYIVDVSASGFDSRKRSFSVDSGQRISLVLPMNPRKDALFGCHANSAPHTHGVSGGMVLLAMLTLALLTFRARIRRDHNEG